MLAFQLAVTSNLISAAMVEASEFPHLSNKYQVYGVPRTVINEVVHIEGALPEAQMVSRMMTVQNELEMAELVARWQREWE